jgi:DNA topoisomerase-1
MNLFFCFKDLGNIKEEFRSVMGVMVLTFVMELLLCLAKGENPLDIDFERAKELIDEAIADAPVAFYKGEGVQKSVGRFGPFIKWSLFINVSKNMILIICHKRILKH